MAGDRVGQFRSEPTRGFPSDHRRSSDQGRPGSPGAIASGLGRRTLAAEARTSLEEDSRIMAEKSSDLPVRIIGSRELHQNLPTILRELERNDVRYVLTVHGKPRAVLVGAEPYMNLVFDRKSPSEALVGLQLSALLGETLNTESLDDLEKALDPKSK
jgi:prevent-host-death family protein